MNYAFLCNAKQHYVTRNKKVLLVVVILERIHQTKHNYVGACYVADRTPLLLISCQF